MKWPEDDPRWGLLCDVCGSPFHECACDGDPLDGPLSNDFDADELGLDPEED